MSTPRERPVRNIPRGVEVLVTKASVDPAFRALLLNRRAAAAEEIELELAPEEVALLDAVPRDQLEAIIARTTVAPEHRRAFLGKAAAAMLAAGLTSAGCGGIRPDDPTQDGEPSPIEGIRPDDPTQDRIPAPTGSRPDPPALPPAGESPSSDPADPS